MSYTTVDTYAHASPLYLQCVRGLIKKSTSDIYVVAVSAYTHLPQLSKNT